jgi:hypothetical protein
MVGMNSAIVLPSPNYETNTTPSTSQTKPTTNMTCYCICSWIIHLFSTKREFIWNSDFGNGIGVLTLCLRMATIVVCCVCMASVNILTFSVNGCSMFVVDCRRNQMNGSFQWQDN